MDDGLIVIICGDRETENDISIIEDAVTKSGFKIKEVVCGDCRGADLLGKQWAESKGIKVVSFPAKWKELDQPGAIIKERKGFKGMEKYNANAGFYRNGQMAEYANACIAIQTNGKTPGTTDMVKKIKAKGCAENVYVYSGPENYEYDF